MLTRTNSEALLGAREARTETRDFTRGVAITSSFHPDEHTHIEPVRYGQGSNAMGLLQTVLTDGGGRVAALAQVARQVAASPGASLAATLACADAGRERTIIALVMQTLDNSITVSARTRLFGRAGSPPRQGHGAAQPDLDPGRQRGRPPDGRARSAA